MKAQLLIVFFVLCLTSVSASSQAANIHACGSDGISESPAKPIVRLSSFSNSEQIPGELQRFFIDNQGRGYFEKLRDVDEETIVRAWGSGAGDSKTFFLLGQYAWEKVDRVKEKYCVRIKFKNNRVKEYKISGPRITKPCWISGEYRGES